MTNDAVLQELHELVTASIYGEMTADERLRLEKLVCEDAAARRLYVDYMFDSFDLHSRTMESPVESGQLSVADDASLTPDTHHSSLHTHQPKRRFRASHHKLSISIAVAIAVVAAGLFTLHMMEVSPFVAGGGDKQDQPPNIEELEQVAKLTNWYDDKWLEDTRPPRRDPRLVVGQRLVLASGKVEIKYNTGAVVVLEGPAEYEVLGENSGYLEVGLANARVYDEGAKGFAIGTPTAWVEDLGTEFGVEVRRDKRTEVHVMNGNVTIAREAKGAHFVELAQGQSATLDTTGKLIATGESTPARFASLLAAWRKIEAKPVEEPLDGEPIAIRNASFEAPPNAPDRGNAVPLVWQSKGSWDKPIFDPTDAEFAGTTGDNVNTQGTLPDGGQVAFVSADVVLWQTLDIDVVPDREYTLSFGVGRRASGMGGAAAATTNYRVELMAGGDAIIQSENPVTPPPGRFRPVVLRAKAPEHAKGKLTIRFTSLEGNTGKHNQQSFIDDVRLHLLEE